MNQKMMNKLEMKTKSIIYSRISSTSNNQQHDRQINDLKALDDYRVVKTFKETISAFTRPIEERIELHRAIKYALKNNINVILIHEISRLGIKTNEILDLLDNLKKKGIKIYVRSLNLLINDDKGNHIVNNIVIKTMLDIANMESEQLSYRIKSGLQERKRKGLAIGRQYETTESTDKFLNKHKKIIKYLNNGESIRWISNQLSVSPTTVQKVKHKINEEK